LFQISDIEKLGTLPSSLKF